MKKLMIVLALVIAAGFTACEDTSTPAVTYTTIVFHANHAAATGTMSNQKIAAGSSANLNANGFNRAEYTFSGWATSSSGTTATYANEASYTAAAGTHTVNLYALWTQIPANTTVIIFHKNHADATGTMSDQQISAGASANLTTNTFERIGYTFAGWAQTSTGTTVDFANEYNYTAAAGAHTLNLYAIWTQVSTDPVTVSFNVNGGTGGQTAAVSAIYGQAMPALSATAPTNEGNTGDYPSDYYNTLLCNNTTTPGALYTVSYPSDTEKYFVKKYFNGYWDAASGGKQYYNANLSSATTWDKTANTTLYAQWQTVEEKYSITLGNDDFVAYFVDTPPTIDGNGNDPAWAKARWQPIKYQWMYSSSSQGVNITQATNAADFSGRFKAVWTADRLYILTEITDDIISVIRNEAYGTGYTDAHDDDCLEFFIDEDATFGSTRSNSANGNTFFTYHMGYRDGNHFAADYIGTTYNNNSTDLALRVQGGIILRNVHLNYVRIRNGNTDTWETEMKVYDNTYPLAKTPGMPTNANSGPNGASTESELSWVTLTEGKRMGLAVAYCDSDGTGTSTTTNKRNHFFGSMAVTGADDGARNQSYLNSTGYAKIHLVK